MRSCGACRDVHVEERVVEALRMRDEELAQNPGCRRASGSTAAGVQEIGRRTGGRTPTASAAPDASRPAARRPARAARPGRGREAEGDRPSLPIEFPAMSTGARARARRGSRAETRPHARDVDTRVVERVGQPVAAGRSTASTRCRWASAEDRGPFERGVPAPWTRSSGGPSPSSSTGVSPCDQVTRRTRGSGAYWRAAPPAQPRPAAYARRPA